MQRVPWKSLQRIGLIAVALVVITAGTAMAQLPPGGSFRDDNGNPHEGNIEAIAAEGITKGCNPPANNLFCPGDRVTRGQMAAFLSRALSLPAASDQGFTDTAGSVFRSDIDRLAAAGVTLGCNPPANTRYCPDRLVTRGQMAAFLVRGLGYVAGGDANRFRDDDGSTFERDIDKLATAGVTQGCNPPANDRFCPDANVVRGQMASFLARALDLPQDACDPSYPDFCMPPHPPDLNCPDVPANLKPFRVLPPDPHNFDGNKDGRGCEGG